MLEVPGTRINNVRPLVPYELGQIVIRDVQQNSREAQVDILQSFLIQSVDFVIPIIMATWISDGTEAVAVVQDPISPLAGQSHVPLVSAQVTAISELLANAIPDVRLISGELCILSATAVETTTFVREGSAHLQDAIEPLSGQMVVPYVNYSSTLVAPSEAILEIPASHLEASRTHRDGGPCREHVEKMALVPARAILPRDVSHQEAVQLESPQCEAESFRDSQVPTILVQKDDFDTVWMEDVCI